MITGLWHGLNWLTNGLYFKATSLLFLPLPYYRICTSLFWCHLASQLSETSVFHCVVVVEVWHGEDIKLTAGVWGAVKEKEKKNKVFIIKNANWQFLKQQLMAVLCWTYSSCIQSDTISPENTSPEWVGTAGAWISNNSLWAFNKLFSNVVLHSAVEVLSPPTVGPCWVSMGWMHLCLTGSPFCRCLGFSLFHSDKSSFTYVSLLKWSFVAYSSLPHPCGFIQLLFFVVVILVSLEKRWG